MENLSQFLCESWTFCFQLCIHSLWEISDVPRERWYIVHFTLNYPWAVYPGCRLTKSWMQDNGAGSLHSWLVLAWINSGAVEAFHQLSCDTAPPPPPPITHVNLTWLHADLVWLSLIPITFCGVPVLVWVAWVKFGFLAPVQRWYYQTKGGFANLTASDFERACQSELSNMTVLTANLIWCCVWVKKPPQVSSTGEWSTQVPSE